MKVKEEQILEVIEKGAKVIIADKFAEHYFETERDPLLRGTEVLVVGKVIGETLTKSTERVVVPTHLERFLKTKRCPKYLKELTTYDVKAYYPRLSLPKEKHWLSFERVVE